MFRKLISTAGMAVLVLAVAGPAAAQTFNIDPVHSSVGFKVRHLVSKTAGRFDAFAGTIVVDRDDLTKSSVELSIKAASIDTDNEDRDAHLKGADFFDVEKYPEMTFKSTKIDKADEDVFDVTGEFTMHGVTKTITIPVEILGFGPGMQGGTTAGFETRFKLDRKDYGIVWNRALDAGSLVVGNTVEVSITVEAHAS